MWYPSTFLTLFDCISNIHRHHLALWKLVRLAYLPLYCPAVISPWPSHPSSAIVLLGRDRLLVCRRSATVSQRTRLGDVSGSGMSTWSSLKVKHREGPTRRLLRSMDLKTAADGPAPLRTTQTMTNRRQFDRLKISRYPQTWNINERNFSESLYADDCAGATC